LERRLHLDFSEGATPTCRETGHGGHRGRKNKHQRPYWPGVERF